MRGSDVVPAVWLLPPDPSISVEAAREGSVWMSGDDRPQCR